MRRISLAVLALGFPLSFVTVEERAVAASAETCAGEICVAQAWTRATPPGAQNAAVYFSLVNKGKSADSLTAASTAAAASAMVHQSTVAANVVHMEMSGPVELAPGAHVIFAPIGRHIMLDGLKQP